MKSLVCIFYFIFYFISFCVLTLSCSICHDFQNVFGVYVRFEVSLKITIVSLFVLTNRRAASDYNIAFQVLAERIALLDGVPPLLLLPMYSQLPADLQAKVTGTKHTYHIISYHIILYHTTVDWFIISCHNHITSYHIIVHGRLVQHVISYHIILYYVISYAINIILYHTTVDWFLISYHIISYITSADWFIMLYRIMSYRIVSSYLIVSFHIASSYHFTLYYII